MPDSEFDDVKFGPVACSKCGGPDANVHVNDLDVTTGEVTGSSLCIACARKEGIDVPDLPPSGWKRFDPGDLN